MSKTAYLFDEIYMEHNTGYGHPEKPGRLKAINYRIQEAPYFKDLLKIASDTPELKYIEMIHSKKYIKRVEREITGGISFLDSMDTIVCRASYDVALKAVGGCLKLCGAVMEGKANNGFCAVRPPGHHAEKDYAAGFCIFNNIAIAARYIQSKFGINNIAIVDWDVHHGNGTQHSFEGDSSIFYISLHQHPHYPGSGSNHEKGTGKGKGYTINIPMRSGSGDNDYINAFKSVIVPNLDKFKPEVILISAGFDAHRADPLSSINISTDTYYEFTKMLMSVARNYSNDRVIAFLEGGYDLGVLASSVEKVMDAFVNG